MFYNTASGSVFVDWVSIIDHDQSETESMCLNQKMHLTQIEEIRTDHTNLFDQTFGKYEPIIAIKSQSGTEKPLKFVFANYYHSQLRSSYINVTIRESYNATMHFWQTRVYVLKPSKLYREISRDYIVVAPEET